MPRPKKDIPAYRSNAPRKGGKVVVAGFPAVYFPGAYNSAESLEAYRLWLACYLQTGIVDQRDLQTTTVGMLILRFTNEFVETRYVKHGCPTSERASFRVALAPLVSRYCDTPVLEFQPRDLKQCRGDLVAAGYTRKRINQHISRVRRCFKWGVEEGIVPAPTWHALLALESLKSGMAKREAIKVRPVAVAAVEAIRSKVTPPIWTAIQTQLWTGCRPGEVLSMRTCDISADDPAIPIDLRGKCLIYRPATHKTEHHELERPIFLGPKAMEIIEPWLRPDDPTAYLFSPKEAREWYFASLRRHAKMPRKKTCRKQNPKRSPGERYTVSAYGSAIRRACISVGIKPWHPHQLRHTAATTIRATYGVEIARIVLGHQHISTTEIYAEADLDKAFRAIAEIG